MNHRGEVSPSEEANMALFIHELRKGKPKLRAFLEARDHPGQGELTRTLPTAVPPRTSSKRRNSKYIEQQEAKKTRLEKAINIAEKKLKARDSFDAYFWNDRANICKIVQDKIEN
ncbi:MAG: hypothetical protein Q9226_009382 [Calogaya cf. arnoldii]